MPQDRIRNFCIIAHIDHGKSTLADRLLLQTGMVSEREMRAQFLDDMDLERERGITIKAHAVTLRYRRPDGEYLLNLIDTPGHVDFSYEVSRSLAACEGALLVVDATQGIEAQTVANAYLATGHNLHMVPVVNKIDLPSAAPLDIRREICDFLGSTEEEVILASAKTGQGIVEILEAIVQRIPPPPGDPAAPLRALIFDAEYDDYRGVITYIRLVDGSIRKGDRVRMLATGREIDVTELGIFAPGMTPCDRLETGQTGYLVGNIKDLRSIKIGDTVVLRGGAELEPLPGYVEPKSMVYCGLYPSSTEDFESLRKALERLALNDASFSFTPESSKALGFGYRCGFLGLLHMEIIQERLERESDLDLVQTAPNVTYRIAMTNGEEIEVHSPADVPDRGLITEFREPIVKLQIMVPKEYVGTIMTLAEERRGVYRSLEYLGKRALLTYEVPFAEIVFDFYDKLKGATRGYGTMDYELLDYRSADLVRLEILVHGTPVDALSTVCVRDDCERRGRKVLQKLRKEIPRHMFEVALQAAIGGKIVARENIAPFRKNVTAKCYGGDITRKRKLLEKQKEGKAKMRSRAIGSVTVPQKAFLAVLQARDED